MLRIVLLGLLVLFGLLVAAARYLPWWGVALVLVGVYLAVRFGFKFAVARVLQSLFMIPFRAKGAVLRDAIVELHAVEPAEAPAENPAEDEVTTADEDQPNLPSLIVPREYFRVDVTITPRPTTTPFQFWEPGELRLVPFGARVGLNDLGDGSDLAEYELYEDGRFVRDENGKHHGPLRLRMLFGVKPGEARHYKFCYYFEAFGDVPLPAVAPRRA